MHIYTLQIGYILQCCSNPQQKHKSYAHLHTANRLYSTVLQQSTAKAQILCTFTHCKWAIFYSVAAIYSKSTNPMHTYTGQMGYILQCCYNLQQKHKSYAHLHRANGLYSTVLQQSTAKAQILRTFTQGKWAIFYSVATIYSKSTNPTHIYTGQMGYILQCCNNPQQKHKSYAHLHRANGLYSTVLQQSTAKAQILRTFTQGKWAIFYSVATIYSKSKNHAHIYTLQMGYILQCCNNLQQKHKSYAHLHRANGLYSTVFQQSTATARIMRIFTHCKWAIFYSVATIYSNSKTPAYIYTVQMSYIL